MRRFTRRALIAGSLSASLVSPSLARSIEGCGEQPNTAPALQPPLLLTDWAWLGRYREENAKLIASGAKVNAVFLGDSITEGWVQADPDFFAKGNVGRGISGQTTPQLLVRMHADVIALKPRVVHILAGTNDIAQNTGPMRPEDTHNNIMAMCEIARAHGLHIVLGSVPPASKYWWRPEIRPKDAALALNAWIRDYAKKIGAAFADYATALTDENGRVKPSLAQDEVHPTPQGYAVMRRIAEKALGI
ncbi:MAG: GDSL-type esterase/lipase family protein [Gammaproteobacteria bacterium]|nr:GDSL family lipase [Gammaproteobacteria bacterium]